MRKKNERRLDVEPRGLTEMFLLCGTHQEGRDVRTITIHGMCYFLLMAFICAFIGVVTPAVAADPPSTFNCQSPYLRQNLGMCVDIAQSRAISKTYNDRLWDDVSAAVQASPEMHAVYQCVDKIISAQTRKIFHQSRTWSVTVPSIALQNCNGIAEIEKHVHLKGIAHEDLALYMCGEAYTLIEGYIGPIPDALRVRYVAMCGSLYPAPERANRGGGS